MTPGTGTKKKMISMTWHIKTKGQGQDEVSFRKGKRQNVCMSV